VSVAIEQFYAAEKARIEAERKERMEAMGFRTFFKWPQGVTEFTLEAEIPRDHVSFDKDVKVFSIIVEGEEYAWSVSPRSPLYGQALDQLITAPVTLKMNRLGEGMQTRYSLI